MIGLVKVNLKRWARVALTTRAAIVSGCESQEEAFNCPGIKGEGSVPAPPTPQLKPLKFAEAKERMLARPVGESGGNSSESKLSVFPSLFTSRASPSAWPSYWDWIPVD